MHPGQWSCLWFNKMGMVHHFLHQYAQQVDADKLAGDIRVLDVFFEVDGVPFKGKVYEQSTNT